MKQGKAKDEVSSVGAGIEVVLEAGAHLYGISVHRTAEKMLGLQRSWGRGEGKVSSLHS